MIDNFKGAKSKVVFEWLHFVEVQRAGKDDQSTYECQLCDAPHRYNTVKVMPGTCSRKGFSMTDLRLGVGLKCLLHVGMPFVRRERPWTVNWYHPILVCMSTFNSSRQGDEAIRRAT